MTCTGSMLSCLFSPHHACGVTCFDGCVGSRVIELLTAIDGIEFTPDTELSELDGCTLNLLIIKSEREFGCEISDDYPHADATVRDLVAFIQNQIAQVAA